jgi:hypothetical protein
MWDFCGGQRGAGAGFLSEYFGFPCTIFIPPISDTITITYHPGLVQ